VGVQGIRFHDLRHTRASELLHRGVPLKTVSQRLGRANPTVTLNIYAHLMDGDDQQAANVVQRVPRKRLGTNGGHAAK